MIYNALKFGAATSDRIDIGAGASITDLAQSAFTIVAWVYLTALTSNRTVFGARDGGAASNSAYLFRVSGTTGNIQLRAHSSIGAAVRSYITNDTPLAAVSTWNFISATYDSTLGSNRGNIYAGSVVVPPSLRTLGTNTDSGTILTETGANARWGNGDAGSANALALTGDLALGQLYNRALTLAELTQLWANPTPRSGCVNNVLMAENGNSYVRDRSGFGNHGIVTGAVPSFNPLPILNDDHQIAAIHRLRRAS